MGRYGFLGLGIMGSAMAAHLVRAGFEVVVWNRTVGKTEPLQALGAATAPSPRAVTEACPVTFAMLADPAAAATVFFGRDGALEGIGPGRSYIEMSTIDPDTAQRIGSAVAGRGGRFLEAPVSGTRKPAEEGTLIFLAAGDSSLLEEARPAFEQMGKKIFFLGKSGNGTRMKLIVNLIMGGVLTALCEGWALAEKSGLQPENMLEILDSGALANAMFRVKGAMIQQEDFAASFPLKHMQKDLRLAVALGEEQGQPLFAAAVIQELFKQAMARGLGEEDFSALIKAVRG